MGASIRQSVLVLCALPLVFLRPVLAQEVPTEAGQEGLVGTVDFVSNVGGASVFVDGDLLCELPRVEPVEISAGVHVFQIVADGYVPAVRDVTIVAGLHKTLKVVLVRIPEDPCREVACSGHGTCETVQGNARCLCDEGFSPSLTWRECSPPGGLGASLRAQATAGLVLTGLGLAGGALVPAMALVGELPSVYITTGVAFLVLSVGVPLGIESYARYAKRVGKKSARSLYIGARVAAIIGFTAAGPLLGCSWAAPPAAMVATGWVILSTISGLGMGLAARTIREVGSDPLFSAGPSLVPWVAAINGGAAAGVSGRF